MKATKASLFGVLLLAASFFCYLKPQKPYDYWMYVYATGGTAQALQNLPATEIQNFIGYYKVKPLFILASKGFSVFLGPERGVTASAVFFFYVTGVLVWLWAGKKVILTLFLMMSYDVMDAARCGTPDTMLSAFLILGGWLCVNKNRFYWLPLLIAVWVRSDGAILAVLLILLAWHEWKASLSPLVPVIASGLFLNLYFTNLANPKLHASYIHRLVQTATNSSITMLFPFVLIAALAWGRGNRKLIAIAGLAYLFHIILFPNAEVRYAMVSCLIIGIEGIRAISDWTVRPGPTELRREATANIS